MKKVLDPRTKIILLLLAAIYLNLSMPFLIELAVILIFSLAFFYAKKRGLGIVFILIYLLQSLTTRYLLGHIQWPFLLFIVSFLSVGMRQLLPSIMAGTYAFTTTTASEWIAILKKWHFPNWLLIPLAVMTRFFPTIREDYRHIRQAMAFRGIGVSNWDLIRDPIRSTEYIVVPLLMNATKVVEDLTVSALSKGISLPGPHQSIVRLKYTRFDYAYLLLAVSPLIIWIGELLWPITQ